MAGLSADFQGAEIRVGAALSGDMQLLAAELSTRCQACGMDPCDLASCGKDQKGLHWMAARMAFGPDATKEDRYNCKRIIFSKMFGGGPESGARQVGISVEAGVAIHRAFEAIAPRFAQWDQEMRAWVKAGNRGYQSYSGRTIWLPPRHRPHAAGNYAIQGTARELLVDGCLRWGQTRWGHLPLLPIHDELLTMHIPEAEVTEARVSLIECMRNQRFYEIYGVPIDADCGEPFRSWPDSS
jgi:DNA polymerase-1